MTTPARYTKKPVTVEAMRLAAEPDYDDKPGRAAAQEHNGKIAAWITEHATNLDGGEEPDYGVNYVTIPTLEGDMNAGPGDWIIRGIAGEFYPCKPDIFAATYEPAVMHNPYDAHCRRRDHGGPARDDARCPVCTPKETR